jgi:hypothetical protein
MFTFEAAKNLQRKFVEFYEIGNRPRRCVTAPPSCATPRCPTGARLSEARPSPASPTSRKTSPTARYGIPPSLIVTSTSCPGVQKTN